ncbi:MAG TPA: flagellar type III secretion system pore protein FliP [Dehalococcoidia bacterium]
MTAGCTAAGVEQTGQTDPGISIQIGGTEQQSVSTGVTLIVLLTALALAPAMLIMLTSFTRIVVVLSLTRNAIGVPQLPPNQVLVGLALFLTIFIMAPVWKTVNEEALQPYLDGQITQEEALRRAEAPVRTFMLQQTREQDLALFVRMADMEQPESPDDVPTYVVIPAFIISELKTAFQMGFIIFVPFLIIDLVVSSALLAMGMMMLPPVVVSLPFKILLFVLVDGWYLIAGSLVTSFST